MKIEHGKRRGHVLVPRSKSQEQRLLIADFLAGDDSRLADAPDDAEDILATKRCLRALRTDEANPLLDCGESGATRRFLGPVAAALGRHPVFKMSKQLAARPQLDYDELKPGVFELAGDVSSQFVTGLLFALPLLSGDSHLRFTAPLQSKGYVEMTRRVLIGAGIYLGVREDGFDIPGGQTYHPQPQAVAEGDWSGAAGWYAMNGLGSEIIVEGLSMDSQQPDRAVVEFVRRIASAWKSEAVTIDVSGCPDLFPVLSVVAGASSGVTTFVGTRRLELKESNRTHAMFEVLKRFGVKVKQGDDSFEVMGRSAPLDGGSFASFGDHRIAMAIAVGATAAAMPIEIDDEKCVAKSYPSFFTDFKGLSRMTV